MKNVFFIAVVLFSTSCNEGAFDEVQKSNLTIEELSFNLLNKIEKFTELSIKYNLRIDDRSSFNAILQSQLLEITELSKEYLTFVGFSEEHWEEYFESQDDPRLIYVAMLTAAQQTNKTSNLRNRNEKLITCASTALGITAVRTIFTSTKALTTATKAAQILKHIGLRYLGYFGVAVSIYNFTKCISDN